MIVESIVSFIAFTIIALIFTALLPENKLVERLALPLIAIGVFLGFFLVGFTWRIVLAVIRSIGLGCLGATYAPLKRFIKRKMGKK